MELGLSVLTDIKYLFQEKELSVILKDMFQS